MKVGVLGAGYILKSHAKAIKSIAGVTLHAVCDLSRARAERAAETYGAPLVLDNLEALATSDCDVVHILLPPALHIDAARTMLEAGKNVLIEKPMGLSGEECRSLVELANARGLALGVSHNFLFMPAYERVREAVMSRSLGPLDHVSANWHMALPLLQFGPFDNWMVAAPRNLFFELGPHLVAFMLDLVGDATLVSASASHTIGLPGGQDIPRHWNIVARAGMASIQLSLAVTPGQTRRSLDLRALGGAARLDFDGGTAWIERTHHDNPIVNDYLKSTRAGFSSLSQATRNFVRYFVRTLRKQAADNPFEESIQRSVAAFYAGLADSPDPRLSGDFAARVIEFCEDVVTGAGVESLQPSSALSIEQISPATTPSVLVVGGTGFIGRRLVEGLVRRGIGVRVLTRSLNNARVEFAGLDVDLVQGSHGDKVLLERALDGIRVVYHLAKAEGQRWQDYVENDINPTKTLAEAALDAGVERFIYTGTIDSYASDKAGTVITFETPLDPAIASRNLYARSKATCEHLLFDLHRSRGLPLIVLRPGIVIGPGSPPAHLGVCRFTSPTRADFWGDGTSKLPLILVDDVADALNRACDAPNLVGKSLVVTDEPHLSARDYVAEVAKKSGSRIDGRPRPIWRYYLADLIKELIKNAIRHPNRRWPSYHDWACKAHQARYDSEMTQRLLGWRPRGTREALVSDGIDASVERFMR